MSDRAEQRFDQLWRDHAPSVLRYARRHVLPDEVEDVVAETFVVAWRRLSEVPTYGLPWLLGIARNVSADVRRSRRRQDALSDRIALHLGEEPAWPETGSDDAVTAALHRLSDADRELLTLLAWDGLTPSEAAEALGCSRGALKVRLHRARSRFTALLGRRTADPPTVTSLPTYRPQPSSPGGAATPDLDTLLRDADPLRNRSSDDAALLSAARERVDRERHGAVPAVAAPRPRWQRRIALVAAAAAVLTAVPLVVSAVLDDDASQPTLTAAVAVAVAVAEDGSIVCGESYATAIDPADAATRLLPDRLPPGWSYTRIFAREESAAVCVPPSVTALRADLDGLVTGRVSVTGPVEAHVDEGALVDSSVPDTVFGYEALRFDLQPHDVASHRWVWTDDEGREWSAEASGMPLEEGRRALSAVSIDGPRVAWNAAASPGWTLAHLREGAPYDPPVQLTWWVELTDSSELRVLQVNVTEGAAVPLSAGAAVGDRLTTVGGAPAVLGRPRGGEEAGGPPGSEPMTPVLVEVAPGTVAWSWAAVGELPDVQGMLESLRQVGAADPRLATYGTD